MDTQYHMDLGRSCLHMGLNAVVTSQPEPTARDYFMSNHTYAFMQAVDAGSAGHISTRIKIEARVVPTRAHIPSSARCS